MTSYQAYDAGLPCKNASCKSYGSPHPNCRCYSSLAHGGEAHFCDITQPHDPSCEYYQGGGAVGDFDPDAYLKGAGSDVEEPAAMPANVFDPDAYLGQAPDGEPIGDALQAGAVAGANAVVPGLAGAVMEPDEPAMVEPEDVGETAEAASEMAAAKKQYSPAGQAQMAAQHPEATALGSAIGTGISLLTGVGAPAAVAGAAKALVPLAGVVEAGPGAANFFVNTAAKSLQNMITMGALQGSDEISKAMLGQGDPEPPVAAYLAKMSIASLLGFGATAAAESAPMALKKLADQNFVKKANSFMVGIGQAINTPEASQRLDLSQFNAPEALPVDSSAYKNGQKFVDKYLNTGTASVGGLAGAYSGYKSGGVKGAAQGAAQGVLEGYVAGLVGKSVLRNKYVGPSLVRMLSNNSLLGAAQVAEHAATIGGGAQQISKGVTDVMDAAAQQGVTYYSDEKEREKLRDFIDAGGVTQNIQQQIYEDQAQPPQFAEGGLVQKPTITKNDVAPLLKSHDPIATNFPEQNVMLQAARGRISQYLAALQPQKFAPKLAFDDVAESQAAKRTYEKALDIAVKPLSVLDHIKAGTIEPDHVKHLVGMFPELTSHLQKKLTEKISEAQLAGEKPPWKIRQGLSMLMGTALSGEFTPQGIQAAQSIYAPPASPPGQPVPGQATKKKRNTAPLTNSDKAFLTPDQARQTRQQAQS
jgi:hypothetical protein